MDNEVNTLSEAASLEEFKELRKAAGADSAAEPAEKTPQSEEDTPAAKSAADPGTVETEPQEKQAAEKSVDDQIKELRSKGQHAKANKLEREAGALEARKASEAEVARLKQELEAARRPSAERPAAKTETPVQASADDPEPKPTDDKYAGARGYETYLRDCGKWDIRQARREDAAEQVKRAAVDNVRTKVQAAKTKYPDFEAVTAGDINTGTGLILTPAMIRFVEQSDNAMDVVYHLGKNPAERNRIAALTPEMQLAELGYRGKLITTPAAGTPAAPEKKKPAVTKVTAPARVLSGTDAPEPQSTAEARDYDEFKRIRRRRA